MTQSVAQAATTISLTSNHNPSHAGDLVTFTAHVVSQYSSASTGTVYFYNSAGTYLTSGTLSPAGQTSFSAALAAGNYSYFAYSLYFPRLH